MNNKEAYQLVKKAMESSDQSEFESGEIEESALTSIEMPYYQLLELVEFLSLLKESK